MNYEIAFKIIMIFTLTMVTGCSNGELIYTGAPDMMVNLEEVSYKTTEGEVFIFEIDKDNNDQLVKLVYEKDGKVSSFPQLLMSDICTVDLNEIEIYRVSNNRNNEDKSDEASNLYINIKFFDHYENCIFPDNYDDLVLGDFQLKVHLKNEKISYMNIRDVKTGKTIKQSEVH